MKVKVLKHTETPTYGVAAGSARQPVNKDPTLHPLERAREYTRALNAVKMEKMFAKPFIAALDGHGDAVRCLSKTKSSLTPLFSGSCDGEIKLWDLTTKKVVRTTRSHQGFVRGIICSQDDRYMFSCGDDRTVKQWDMRLFGNAAEEEVEPFKVFHAASMLTSIDHHWKQPMFVTSGETVDIWDHHRSTPLNSFEWGCDFVLSAKFNPAESCLVASTGNDNSIGLYDLRSSSAIRKVILRNRSNALAWNPREPLNFTVANEDGNLYTFDMRRLEKAVQAHCGHVMAVLDVDYSACGTEFVSASYDKTIRIWDKTMPKSRDVYHTKRMQRVLACRFSADNRFIFTGSEDTNVRVWKARASEKLGGKTYAEKEAEAYRETLKQRYKNLPEIRRIKNHKHVPKMIKSMQNTKRIQKNATLRKEENRRKFNKEDVPRVANNAKAIRRQEE